MCLPYCVALVMGKLVARVRLPAILGWLIAGVVFGRYLAGVVTLDMMDTTGHKIAIKAFECFAGVMKGTESESVGMILLSVFLPFVIGIGVGWIASGVLRRIQGENGAFVLFLLFLCLSAVTGILTDWFLFHAWKLNYILIGMSFSAAVVNGVPAEKIEPLLKKYNPILSLSLVLVIVNLGMPLDYRLMASAGLFTVLYMVSRAVGKIGGAYVGGKVTGAPETVTKYLGFTLLPHSGVSLVFTGIAATTLNGIDPSLAAMIQGTIVAAAILNEIIAVLVTKYAFVRAGEIEGETPGRKSARQE